MGDGDARLCCNFILSLPRTGAEAKFSCQIHRIFVSTIICGDVCVCCATAQFAGLVWLACNVRLPPPLAHSVVYRLRTAVRFV